MTDLFFLERKIAHLEKHIVWTRNNIRNSHILDKRLSEISELRAKLASSEQYKLTVRVNQKTKKPNAND